ncbi:MAG: BatA domain-containing protein [Bacteroidales bacterium]
MQFLNPYFLFGLFAVAIPIIIHLFNFRRFKKVYFTNVSFLKEIEISTKKQKKVRNRILLLVRILAIVFLVLFFAQPYFPNSEKKLVEKGLNAVVICLDNSFSMQNQGRQGRLLDEAKVKAKQIIDEYNNNDEFLLLTMDMEGKYQQFVSKEKFIELMDEVEISPKSEPNSKLISRSFDLLNTKQGFNKRCFMVSDFQTTAFDTEKFPKDTTIKSLLVPLQANNINNLYVDSISFLDPIFQVGENVKLDIRLVNKSDKRVEAVSVKLFLDNKQIAISSIDIEKNQTKNLELTFNLQKHGIQHGRISIIDNPITFDDDFFFTLQTNPTIEVLSINANNPNPYINQLFSNNKEITLRNMSEKAIDFNEFSNFSLIILNAITEFSSGLASELMRYRENGGSVLIIPSLTMDISSFQSSMQLLSLPYYTELVQKDNKVSIIDQDNKLFRGVFSSEVDNMEMPKVKKYFRLSSSTKTSRESIMKFQSQEDFLLVSQKDASRVYIFTANLTDDFTDFIKQALFVPTIWNMALFNQVAPKPYYFIADKKLIDISMLKDISQILVPEIVSIDNNISFIPQFIKEKQKQSLVLHNQARKSGNYNIVEKGKVYGGLSLNYERGESDLRFLSAKEINSKLKKGLLKDYNVLETKQQLVSSYFKKSQNSFPVSIILLILLFACISVETFILFRNR